MKFACSLAFLLALALSTQALNPDSRLTVLQTGITEALDQLAPYVERDVDGLTFPDIDEGSDPEIIITNIVLTNLLIGEPEAIITNENIQFKFKEINIEISADWSEELLGLTQQGTLEAYDEKASLTGYIDIFLVDGRPVVDLQDVEISLGTFYLVLHGSDLDWLEDAIADILEPFFKSTISQLLEQEIDLSLNGYINELIDGIQQHYDVYGILGLDLAVLTQTYEANTLVDFGLETAFKPVDHPLEKSPYTAASLPISFNDEDDVQILIDKSVVDSALWTLYEEDYLHIFLSSDDIPPAYDEILNTDAFGLVIYKLPKLYPDCPMSLNLSSTAPPTIEFNNTGNQFMITAPTFWSFNVTDINSDDQNIFVFSLNTNITIAASTNLTTDPTNGDLLLKFDITDVEFYMTVNETAIGYFDPILLAALANVSIDTFVLPGINKGLEQGLQIPLPSVIQLVDPRLTLQTNYAEIGTDFFLVLESAGLISETGELQLSFAA